MTGDVLPPRELIDFLLFDWLNLEQRGVQRETMLAIFDAAHRLAAAEFLPLYRKGDVEEPRLDAAGAARILPEFHGALRHYSELGLFGTSFPEELGGLGLPSLAALAASLPFAAANPAAYGYPMLTVANARLITTFGTQAQQTHFALPEIEGRWFGTMCLSEPQAGSSLGDILTRAVPDGEDDLGARYRISGNKMWISGGDQDASENIVHLVLAKVARSDGSLPEGSKGISLFIVPKHLPDGARNDIAVAGLNHKMGFRGTTNCLLNFGENDGATGWIVGEEGQGLAQMFMMMNEARITVGLGAAAIAYRGFRHAYTYAAERLQGRTPGTKGGSPVPIIAHADVRRMLLQQKVYAEGGIALCLYCANLMDEGTDEAEALLALLTPIAKTWPSEFGLIANDLSIQVHGGYGYTRDFDVEQLWRDNRLNPIHEGTTGIQGLDLLGRKILFSDGSGMAALRARIEETGARASGTDQWKAAADELLALWNAIDSTIAGLRTAEATRAMDEATLFLRAFGHAVIGWLWLDQALAAGTIDDTARRAGVEHCCTFFFEAEIPQAGTWLGIVSSRSSRAQGIADAAFG